MTKLYAIYGASGCGRSLMPVARQQLARQRAGADAECGSALLQNLGHGMA